MAERRTLPLLVGPAAVLLVAPDPASSLHEVLSRSTSGTGLDAMTLDPITLDPMAPVVHLVALAAWACAAWLLLLVAATWLAALPGVAGTLGRCATRCLAPRATRTAVRLALGVAVLSAGTTGTALAAGPPLPATATAGPAGQVRTASADGTTPPEVSFEWPGLASKPTETTPGPVTSATAAPSPATTPAHVTPTHVTPTHVTPARSTPGPATPSPTTHEVVVRPGDCLWALAEKALGAHASPAQVAAAWPSWWQANRAVIGEDPDLLQPGTHLSPPRPPPAPSGPQAQPTRARRSTPSGRARFARPPEPDRPLEDPVTAAHPEPTPLLIPLPSLRLLPAPASAPPYDDELPTAPVLRLVPPARPAPRPRPVLTPVTEAQELDAWLAAERTPTSQLPPTRPYARTLVQILVEVLAGVRPLSQLRRETTPELYASIEKAVGRAPRSVGTRPDGRAVRSVHVQERAEGVAEVCATVVRGGRPGALALRLEGLDGRWRCTALAGL